MDLANLAVEFLKELFEEYFVKRNKKTFKDRYIPGSQYIGIHKDTKIFHDDELGE